MAVLVPYIPEDFDSFWSDAVEEARAEPFDFSRSLSNDFEWPGFRVETIAFRGINGSAMHGWIAYELGSKRNPAFLWLPPYGRESLVPNEFGTREGFTSLSFNFHGHEAFHQETYTPSRGYFSIGIESPETFIFRSMIQNAIIATRVLQAQPEVDENRIGAAGMSQGGGMAIWLGVLSPIVKAICSDMPFFGGIRYVLEKQVYRYPLKEITDFAETVPLGMQRALNTIAYYDTLNFAARCDKPTRVTFGTKDPAVRTEQVEAIFEALKGEKEIQGWEWGHDWHEEMIAGNREWLVKHLGTQNAQ